MEKKISAGTLSNQGSSGKPGMVTLNSDEPPVLNLLDAKDPR